MISRPGDPIEPKKWPQFLGVRMLGIILTLVAALITLSFAFYSGYAEGQDPAKTRREAALTHRSRSPRERKPH